MLRAVRFAVKLGLSMDDATGKPIRQLGQLLESAAAPRLFDELLKLFGGGHAEATFRQLREMGLDRILFSHRHPSPQHISDPADRLVELALRNTDSRIAKDLPVTPAFLLAALLWPALQQRLGPMPPPRTLAQIAECGERVVVEQAAHTTIPRRISFASRQIWELQHRLECRNRRAIAFSHEHPRFRAAYDFLLLREQSGEQLGGMGAWWTAFQQADKGEQATMLDELPGRSARKRRKRRGRRRATPERPA